jgi:hypothetical protein
VYEKTLLLKQGYYSYTYVTKEQNTRISNADVLQTDGSFWET